MTTISTGGPAPSPSATSTASQRSLPGSSRPDASSLLRGAAAMAVVGSSVAVSGALDDAPLLTAQAVRYAVAALVLVAIARARRIPLPRPRGVEWLWLAAVAGAGLVLFNVALVRGAAHAEPAVLGVGVAAVPVLLAVVGPLLAGTRPARRVLVAAAVVTVGALLVQGGGRTDRAGIGYAVLVLACEAGFTLLAVPVLGRLGTWGVSVWAVALATVVLAVGGVSTEGPDAVLRLTAAHLLALAYLAVLLTAVAFVLWYGAVGRLGAGRAGLLCGLAPVAAAATGVLMGAPLPGPMVWAGLVVVLAGLALGLPGGGAAAARRA